jgi:hypothetical protein
MNLTVTEVFVGRPRISVALKFELEDVGAPCGLLPLGFLVAEGSLVDESLPFGFFVASG